MKTYFYEINEPYSAIIKAHNEDEVLEVYEEFVCDIEDDKREEFLDSINVISEVVVKKRMKKATRDIDSTELMTPEEQEKIFNEEAPCLIIMEAP